MFAGKDSINFFKLLKINVSFIRLPVDEWKYNDDFLAGKNIVHSLSVVNDAAERGVKLCSDYLEAAKIEKRFQNILQVVENHRKALPNLRKRKLPRPQKNWFLKLDN